MENEEEIIVSEKKNSFFSWLHLNNGFIQLILFVSAFLVGYFFINYTGKNIPNTTNITPTPTLVPTDKPYPTTYYLNSTPSITEVPITFAPLPTQSSPIEGNLTLSNVNGYSINYPPSYSITSGGGGKVETDITKTDLIWITKSTPVNIFENPYMQIVFFTPEQTSYQEGTIREIAEKNLKANIENTSLSSGIVELLHETTFRGKTVYVYSFNCNGFTGIYEGSLSVPGVCKMIFGEHNNKYFFIGYYQIPEFEQILSSFNFVN